MSTIKWQGPGYYAKNSEGVYILIHSGVLRSYAQQKARRRRLKPSTVIWIDSEVEFNSPGWLNGFGR